MQDEAGLVFDLPQSTRRVTPTSFLLDAIRRREAGRQVLSVLTTVLFVAGGALFTWPLLTDVYTNQFLQNDLAEDFALIENSVSTFDEYASQVSGVDGVALTKISIPAIGLETLVVEGTSPSALRAGAGHYVDTPLPGQPGNVGIAGHRTTYGRPFNRLDELEAGATVWLATPYGDFRYEVVDEPASPSCAPTEKAACITNPNDWAVVEPPDDGAAYVTLTTCHPKGSAAKRLIIRAKLVESRDPGTADA